MNDLRVFVKSDDLVARTVGEETILVPVRYYVGNLDSVYTLTPVAARIWSLIDGKRAVEAIVDHVVEEYNVDREIAAPDVTELLGTLETAGLILLDESGKVDV